MANTKAHQVFEGESCIAVETGRKQGKTVRHKGAEEAHEKGCWLFHSRAGVGDECGAKAKDYGTAKFPSSDLSLRSRFPEQMTKYPRISDLLGTKQ